MQTNLDSLDAPPPERRKRCAPLDALPRAVGVRFTALLQRSWSAQRRVNPGLLVLSMLQDEVRRGLLESGPHASSVGTSSCFAAEADALLDVIARQLPENSPELAVCRLEQLTLRAIDAARSFDAPARALFGPQRLVRRGAHAGLVVMPRELDPVLHSLFSPARYGAPPGGIAALLVAPAAEPLCRMASAPEQELWMSLGAPAIAGALMQGGAPRTVLEAMLQIGALEYA